MACIFHSGGKKNSFHAASVNEGERKKAFSDRRSSLSLNALKPEEEACTICVWYKCDSKSRRRMSPSLFFFFQRIASQHHIVSKSSSVWPPKGSWHDNLYRGGGPLCVCLYFGECLLTCMNTPLRLTCIDPPRDLTASFIIIYFLFVYLCCFYYFILCRRGLRSVTTSWAETQTERDTHSANAKTNQLSKRINKWIPLYTFTSSGHFSLEFSKATFS